MPNKNTTLAVGAILAIVGALAFLYSTQFGGGAKLSLKPLESLGFVVAEETARLLKQQGSVLVVTEVMESVKSPHVESQLKGFRAGLAKSQGVTLKGLQELKRNPEDDAPGWPSGQAERIANMGKGAGAVVLFITLPKEISQEEIAELKESKSKLIVVTAQSPTLKTLLQQGAIHLGIVNRFPPQPAPAGSETPRQWFDRVYLVVKPDALGELP